MPVLSVAVEPRHQDDRSVIEGGVRRLVRGDPTLGMRVDGERDVILLTGMGELHLEVAAERLRAEIGDCFRIGRPEVAFRETVARAAAGAGEWRVPELQARVAVRLRLAPVPGAGPARVFPAAALEASAPAQSLCAALAALLASSLRAGWPAHDLEVEVVALEHQAPASVDVGPLLVEAARVALRRALVDAEPRLLQPLVRLDVACPIDALSPVLADLRGKGAEVEEVDVDGDAARVRGQVPLTRMLGYATRLRSLTRGLATFQLHAAGYAPAHDGEAG
jgi:elongation factor G